MIVTTVAHLFSAMTVSDSDSCPFVQEGIPCPSLHGNQGVVKIPMPLVGHVICAHEMLLHRVKSGGQDDFVVRSVALIAA